MSSFKDTPVVMRYVRKRLDQRDSTSLRVRQPRLGLSQINLQVNDICRPEVGVIALHRHARIRVSRRRN